METTKTTTTTTDLGLSLGQGWPTALTVDGTTYRMVGKQGVSGRRYQASTGDTLIVLSR